jgi:cysteine synthase A
MKPSPSTILDTIGNTSLLQLRNVVPANDARIFAKLESQNPTDSMKDRIALATIEAPERDGRLKPGGAVVEYTGGRTGVSLALVCSVKGHPLHLVSSDAFSKEKLDHMRLLGAQLTIVPSDNGKQTEKLTRDMIREAHRIADEIWEQTSGRIDGFVENVGTAASLRGISQRLREHDARIRVVSVEPAESCVHGCESHECSTIRTPNAFARSTIEVWPPGTTSPASSASYHSSKSGHRTSGGLVRS